MDYNLTFWQKLMADLGRPNDNGGSNYSDDEMRYYLRNVLKDYDEFIPTPVARDSWTGARIREAQPMSGGTNYPDSSVLDNFVRDAINTRLTLRNAPAGTLTPTGADSDALWSAPLSPRDAILKQIMLGQQQGSAKEYFPPVE